MRNTLFRVGAALSMAVLLTACKGPEKNAPPGGSPSSTPSSVALVSEASEEEKVAIRGAEGKLAAGNLEGLAEFGGLLKANPKLVPDIHQSAIHLLKQKKASEATKLLNLLSVIAADNREVSSTLAKAYSANGQKDQAVIEYTKLVAKDPGDWESFYARGANLAELQGRKSEALLDFSRVIELNPDFARAYTRRALLHQGFGESEAAMTDLNRALELDPEDGIAKLNRAKFYYRAGKLDECRSDLESILESKNTPTALVEARVLLDKVKAEKNT